MLTNQMQQKLWDIKMQYMMRRVDEIRKQWLARQDARKDDRTNDKIQPNHLSSFHDYDTMGASMNGDSDDLDPDGWVTINNARVNIGEGGEIKAGMGGKYTGQKIGEIGSGGESSAQSGGEQRSSYVQGADISANYSEQEMNDFNSVQGMLEAQGFDGHPQTMSSDELDAYIQEHGTQELFRGYTGSDADTIDGFRQQFTEGEIYVSGENASLYGSGIYASDQISVARQYARGEHSRVDRMVLHKDARVLEIANFGSFSESMGITQPADAQMLFNAGLDWPRDANTLSNFAVSRGYDAIRVQMAPSGHAHQNHHVVILNRTALLVDDKNHR